MNNNDNNNKKKDDFPYVYVGNEREAETLDSPDPAPPNQGAADIYSCRCVVLLKKNTASIFEGFPWACIAALAAAALAAAEVSARMADTSNAPQPDSTRAQLDWMAAAEQEVSAS